MNGPHEPTEGKPQRANLDLVFVEIPVFPDSWHVFLARRSGLLGAWSGARPMGVAVRRSGGRAVLFTGDQMAGRWLLQTLVTSETGLEGQAEGIPGSRGGSPALWNASVGCNREEPASRIQRRLREACFPRQRY